MLFLPTTRFFANTYRIDQLFAAIQGRPETSPLCCFALRNCRRTFAMIVNEGPNYSIDNTAMQIEAKGDSLTVKLLKRDGSIYHTFKIK